jgi:nucleoside-diphosphate-sugar epimerase
MKAFVAGATGVLGRRAVARLVAAGIEVTGAARSDRNEDLLLRLGAAPLRVGLFDRDALVGAVSGHDVVLNLATAVPTGERAARRSGWEDHHRIRRQASHNLVDAALEAGASRYVQESITLLYADGGDRLLDESAPVEAVATTSSALDAEAEAARFARHGGAGVVLRFGTFYGHDSAHTLEEIAAARAGVAAMFGPAGAYRSSITTDDAAGAAVAALRAPGGTYNVVDDRPLRRSEFVAALTTAFGMAPLALPDDPDLPREIAFLMRSQRVANDAFRAATGWSPGSPSAWEGWRAVAGDLGEAPHRRPAG